MLPCLWSLQSGYWGSWSAPSRGPGSWTGWGQSPGWGGPEGSCWLTRRPAGLPGHGDARWCPHTESCSWGRHRWNLPDLDRNRSPSSSLCCSELSYWSWCAWYDSDSWWSGRWKDGKWRNVRKVCGWIGKKGNKQKGAEWTINEWVK